MIWNGLHRVLLGFLACFTASHSTSAQWPTAGITSDQMGDPYQMVVPATAMTSGSLVPTGVVPTGGLLGGRILNGQLFSGDGPYASPAISAQLNAPIVNGAPVNSGFANGDSYGGGLFNGGLLNRYRNGDPLFPGVNQHFHSRLYVRAEYLLWDVSGMDSPSLVTTSPAGTDQSIAGVLGEPGVQTLFGGNELNDGHVSGFLFGGGLWITPARNVAIETEYFQLGEGDDGFSRGSDGSMILARPFFDITQNRETAQLISFPGVVRGNVNVNTESNFRSFLVNARIGLCSQHGAGCQQCGERDRTDWIIGYRNLRLRDSLQVNENLVSLLNDAPGSVALTDRFQTTNQFHGLQLGVVHRSVLSRAWLESSLKVALGNNEQTQRNSSSTTYTETGITDTFPGGLLAQRTNSGTFSRDEFTMVPELGLRLGIRINDRLHATIGYSAIYLPNVIRAASQIDSDVNPGLIPEEIAAVQGALRPRLLWVQDDYLAHGLHFGGELSF